MIIAIVQDAPEFNQLDKSIEKTCDIISQLAKDNVDLIVFGECWLSGYPFWLDVCSDAALWDHSAVKEIWQQTFESSVDINNNGLEKIQKILQQEKMYAVVGLNEKITKGKGNNTIYI